jgi:AraC family transcriptional regulator, ethanolamine operon transcriptional activator
MSLIQFGHPTHREPIDPGARYTRPEPRARQSGARSELVTRAITLLREHVSEPVTMVELSRQTGVSERTLRAAFHDVLGLSPKQYAIGQRLRAAHDALCAADPSTTTVTDIATEYGFYELGRFARRYRNAFGEVPSQTLHQPAAPWSGEAA